MTLSYNSLKLFRGHPDLTAVLDLAMDRLAKKVVDGDDGYPPANQTHPDGIEKDKEWAAELLQRQNWPQTVLIESVALGNTTIAKDPLGVTDANYRDGLNAGWARMRISVKGS